MKYRPSRVEIIREISFFFILEGWVYAFFWPLPSILIRLRAHYAPRQGPLYLSDDPSGNGNEGTADRGSSDAGQASYGDDSNVRSYISLATRMMRIEGRKGFTQGIFVYLVYGRLIYLTSAFKILWIGPRSTLLRTIGDLLVTLAFSTIRLPILVFLYRAITSSRYIRVSQMFSALLSPGERRNLLKLYLIPGLFTSVLSLDIAYYCLTLLRDWLFVFRYVAPVDLWFSPNFFTFRHESLLELFLLFGSILVITIFLCPLELIVVRLALQKYRTTHYHSPSASVLLTISDDEHEIGGLQGREGIQFLGSEDVINLRGEIEPYGGLVDCAKKIVSEEGWNVFWRGWLIAFGVYFLCDPNVNIRWYFFELMFANSRMIKW